MEGSCHFCLKLRSLPNTFKIKSDLFTFAHKVLHDLTSVFQATLLWVTPYLPQHQSPSSSDRPRCCPISFWTHCSLCHSCSTASFINGSSFDLNWSSPPMYLFVFHLAHETVSFKKGALSYLSCSLLYPQHLTSQHTGTQENLWINDEYEDKLDSLYLRSTQSTWHDK